MFTTINTGFAKSTFSDFEVIVMTKKKYVNVTKLIGQAKTKGGGDKTYSNWRKNNFADVIIQALSDETGLLPADLLVEVRGGNNPSITGTYAHPLLVQFIISWASPYFAVKVSIFLERWRALSPKNEVEYWTEMGIYRLS
jgi:hypothetical protein